MNRGFTIKGVLFDFDGTLTNPGALDFSEIRREICCPENKSILEFIDTLQNRDQRNHMVEILTRFEMEGAERSVPNLDVEIVFRFLQACNLPVGLISRNGLRPIQRALENFHTLRIDDFHLVITRDDDLKPKPSGDGVRFAAEKFAVQPTEILVVGDYVYDIEAGKQAGAVTALLRHPDVNISFCAESDFVISRLLDIIEIVRLGLPMLPGKMPGEFLAPFLEGLDSHDPDIIIPPGIGEDTVAVKAGGETVLVMKSDPITFVTNEIGYYTVLINVNDIATAGAKPRWMLNTLLFPVGTTPSSALFIMNELKMVCRKWGISLCGGHTEITSAVNRPIAIGMLVGTVEKDKLIDKRRMQEGDQILITKRVAVEGTAIIAGELSDRLRKMGLSQEQIESGIKLKEEISIVKEAMIAAEHGGISAMHDVTEGGLATAITELSIAGNQKLRIQLEKIPFYPITEIFCKKLHLDPLGLIGSGVLLICCRKEACPELIEKVKSAGIDITCIGEVGQPGAGVEAFKKGEKTTWPSFQTDEITRVLL